MFGSALSSYLILASLLGLVTSDTITKPQECIVALVDIYGNLQFTGIGYGDYYESLCHNPEKVASMYAASKVYCTVHEINAGMKIYESYCNEYSTGPLLPKSDVAANISDKAIRNMQIIGPADATALKNFTTPVLISKQLFKLAYRTEDDWDFEFRTHTRYGWAMYGFWGGILLIGMLHRLVTIFRESRLVQMSSHVEDNGTKDNRSVLTTFKGPKFARSLSFWARKHITTPSALPPYRRQPFYGCTVPTRLESIVIYLFWAINIILCAVDLRGFGGNLYWSDISTQIWRYVSDRTGILSYANLPILWMFSGRNNIFLWLTGWSFSTFNLFHRHVARIATLQAIIHSVGYTVFYYKSGDWMYYLEYYKQSWFYLGVVACIAMSFIVLFSFRFFRHRIYESFLLIHIGLSVVVIVALFYHTSIFTGEYNPYLWPLVAIWSFDRFLRLVRLIYCNIHVRFQKGQTIHHTSTTVTYRQDANILEIQILPATKHLGPGPGQHYFLYQPFRLTGWENHPFTLASWTHDGSSLASSQQRDSNQGPCQEGNSEDTLFSFYIRPCDGWTKQLRKKCLASPNSTVSTTILIEGPYGHSEPLWAFEEVLLIAGGSGIAAIIPYLNDHIRRTSESKTRTRYINLVWTDRREEYVKLLTEGPLQNSLAREDVNATFYISTKSPESPVSSSLEISEKHEAENLGEGVLLKQARATSTKATTRDPAILQGRPDIGSIIEKKARIVSEEGSRLAVFVCGPAGLADTARDATYRSMHGNNDHIQYFEEAFGW